MSSSHLRTVHLPAAAPWSPAAALGHVVATAVPGCEEVRDGWYRRTIELPAGPGVLAVRPAGGHAECRLHLTDVRDEPAAVSACRRLLDLETKDEDVRPRDPREVAEVLCRDPALRPVVELSPGQRLPRCADPAELAVRAVLGQQVSTSAARTLAHRLVLAHGAPLPADPDGGLTHLWPSPDRLTRVPAASLAMPASRRRTFAAMAQALADGVLDLRPGTDVDAARQRLRALPGVGPWTVEIVALRGLGDPDAFPVTDLGVRRAAEGLGLPSAPTTLLRHAERWRPFRAYAVQYLWSTLDHEVNRSWQNPQGGAA
jgi:AraC family transcriptional regulator of adaptative response / DNA-3-methyladenine glycosylase II